MAVLRPDKKVRNITLLLLGLAREREREREREVQNEKKLSPICLNALFLYKD